MVNKTIEFLDENASLVDIRKTKRSSKERKANLLNKSISSDKTQLADNVFPYQYRALDQRSVLYVPDAIEAGDHRWPIMRHLTSGSIGLASTRQTSKGVFNHALVCSGLVDMCYLSTSTKECAYCFPLYLMPSATETAIRPNLSNSFTHEIASHTGLIYDSKIPEEHANMGRGDLIQTFGPRDIFDFLYAVLHSPSYRARYADFLKSEFARIPIPSNADLFRALTTVGKELVNLHLLDGKQAEVLANPETRFIGKGEVRSRRASQSTLTAR